MAITFVGSHVGTHAATSAQTVAFSNLKDEAGATPTLQQGDIVYVAVENASTLDRSIAGGADIMVPSGYTGLGTHDYRNDSNDSNFRVSRKVMGSTPDTSVAIPPSNATTAGVAYAIYVFRGVNATTPEAPTIVVTGGTNTGVANAAAITPANAGSWIVVFGGAAVAAGAVFSNPAGMSATTNHFRSATITTTTNDANIGGAIYTAWTSGAYDPAAFGGSTTTNTGSWSAATLALNPIVTHANTGTLIGPGSTVVGTAARTAPAVTHTTTGALTGPGSAIVGSADRQSGIVSHDTNGALIGSGSVIVGAASSATTRASSGILVGPGSTIVGSAARTRAHATDGVLSGQGAIIVGAAARVGAPVTHDTSGVLVGQGSAVSGDAIGPGDITPATYGTLIDLGYLRDKLREESKKQKKLDEVVEETLKETLQEAAKEELTVTELVQEAKTRIRERYEAEGLTPYKQKMMAEAVRQINEEIYALLARANAIRKEKEIEEEDRVIVEFMMQLM